jgi:D-alanine-D-alanine ligase
MNKLTVGIIFGGRSGEHEISLLSARSVIENINPDKYEIVEIGITHQGNWLVGKNVLESMEQNQTEHLTPACLIPEPGNHYLYTREAEGDQTFLKPFIKIDVFFPVLHGTLGEDGTIQGLFEMAEIAYVGAGVLGSATGMDKAVFKQIMRANQIPVVDDIVISRKEFQNQPDEIIKQCEKLGPYPFFTKPANMGSSVGINKCTNRQQLIEGIKEAALYDRRILVEIGLNKPMEIEVSVLGNEFPKASIPGEIVPGDEFYSYDDKYINGISSAVIPAELPEGMLDTIRNLAVKAYQAIDCAGLSRVDFMVNQEGNAIYLNEINTMPGFTKISMYPKLWSASGVSYKELIDRLIEFALDRQKERLSSIHLYQRKNP